MKYGVTELGTSPMMSLLINFVNVWRKVSPLEGAGEDKAFFKCSGRRPSGPGAVPALKDEIEDLTRSALIWIGGGRLVEQGGKLA